MNVRECFGFLRRIAPIAVVVACHLSWAGCEGEKPTPKQGETVRVGVVYPFSGPLAATGRDLRAGADLAAEIINQTVDLPLPMARTKGLPSHREIKLEIVYRDSRNDPSYAAEMVEELAGKEGVVAVLGCYSSTVTSAASERAEMLRLPFLNADSTSPTLTQRGLRWFFRTTPHDEMFTQNFFAFLSELEARMKIRIPRRLILVYENRLWGTSVARAERKLALRSDFEVAGEVPYDAQRTDFREELDSIQRLLPGLIFQASYSTDAVLFMEGYKARQMNPVAILAMDAGFISPEFSSSLGADAEFVFSREVWALDTGRNKPLVSAVNDLFRKRMGRDMTGNSARAFTGILTLADALNRATSLKPEAVREALVLTELSGDQLIMPWDGVKFDPENGQNMLGKGIIVQMQEGRYVTVWPWDLAARPVVWPMPTWSERGKAG